MSGPPVITLTPIKNLNLLSYNPRTITTEAMDKLCKSLREDPDFLRNRPVLVNRVDGVLNVYAGTQRVRAAKKLKWKEVPCIVEENLSDDLIKVRMNKDNLHSGEFDWDILGNEFELEDLFAKYSQGLRMGEFTILELAKKVLELTGSKSKIIFEDLPVDDPKQRKPDISKAKKILNWEPKINFQDGLIETINYFKSII